MGPPPITWLSMSYTDAVSRVSQIQAQITSLQTAFDPSVAAATSQSAAPSATGTASTGTGSSSTFANVLARAQDAGSIPTTGGALPSSAQTMLTSNQQQFASRLAADTGLDPSVVSAWLLAEESGGAAQSRQSQGNNDWLNIGYTDSATYGSSDPATAADATAGWLKGQNTIPGYGTASSGIQAILNTAGQPPATQIAALQNSGWASSGYPSLASLYQQVAG
jgi:hypothetical protein